jgi:Putative Flp pilus-assembly TadE/G-like/von Willebrand factor type A domain
MQRVLKFGRGFARGTAGSVAVAFALALLPLIGITGAAIDFSRASGASSRLKAAADAAVLSALKAKPAEDPIVIGKKVFKGNVDALNDSRITVTRVVMTVNNERTKATLKFEADVKMSLASVIRDKVSIDGMAESTIGAGDDIDAYFVIDTSLSMQFPMDPTRPIPNIGGCFFSCHLDRASIKAMGSVSRLDAGIDAFKQIADTLYKSNSNNKFNAFTSSLKLNKLVGPTSNKNILYDALDNVAFETSTHMAEHLSQLAQFIVNSPSNYRKTVILMTDGLEEHRNTDVGIWAPNDPNGDHVWVGAFNGVGEALPGYGFQRGGHLRWVSWPVVNF